MNDGCLIESRREERVLQLLRLLNPGLEKRKETAKRQLLFALPRVVAVSPQMRLVEDNPSSISLLDIFKNRCVLSIHTTLCCTNISSSRFNRRRCARKSMEHDALIDHYYEKLALIQSSGKQVSCGKVLDVVGLASFHFEYFAFLCFGIRTRAQTDSSTYVYFFARNFIVLSAAWSSG